MDIEFSTFIIRKLQKIKQKDSNLIMKIERQLAIFQSNPKHPSLRLHKLTSGQKEAWSISITMSIRMIYYMINEKTAVFIDIGTHDEVYKK